MAVTKPSTNEPTQEQPQPPLVEPQPTPDYEPYEPPPAPPVVETIQPEPTPETVETVETVETTSAIPQEAILEKEAAEKQIAAEKTGQLATPVDVETGEPVFAPDSFGFVDIYDARGNKQRVTYGQYVNLQRLAGSGNDEAYFNELVNAGLVPAGSEFVPSEKTGGGWSFVLPEDVPAYKAAQKPVETKQPYATVELADGTRLDYYEFAKLPEGIQQIGRTWGYDAMAKEAKRYFEVTVPEEKMQQELAKYQKSNADDSLILISDYDALPEEYKQLYMSEGYDALNRQMQVDDIKYNAALKILDNYKDEDGYYNIAKLLKDNENIREDMKDYLRIAGFDESDIESAEEQANLGIGQTLWRGITPWEEEKGETVTLAGGLQLASELIVPGLATALYWDELKPFERGAFIALDAASVLLPVAGGAVRGARAAGGTTARATAKGALKGVAQEIAAQVKAPVTMILHPIATAKAGARQIANLAENIIDLRKVPEAVLTTTNGTVRIPVTAGMTEAEAMAARDVLMVAAKRGERLVIEAGDYAIELAESPFMKEARKAGGAVTHTTPGGDVFENILEVAKKEGMPLSEQGIFFANEPLPRFATQSAFGTAEITRPTIYVASKDTAKLMKSSGKIYRNTAELESVLPVGAKTSGPAQRLYTRVGANADIVQILLEKPLSKSQIAKLKAQGLIETVKAPFRPAIKINVLKRNGLTNAEVRKLAAALRKAGNASQADNLNRLSELLERTRPLPRSLASVTGRISEAQLVAARDRLNARIGRAIPTIIPLRGYDIYTDYERMHYAPLPIVSRRVGTTERIDRAVRTDRIDAGMGRIGRTLDETRRVERSDIDSNRLGRITGEDRPRVTPRNQRIPRPEIGTPRQPRIVRSPGPMSLDRSMQRSNIKYNDAGKQYAKVNNIPEGSIAWAQGIGWYHIPPPYNQSKPIWTKQPPIGARNTQSNSPYDTIQVIGSGEVPGLITIDMGTSDVIIKNGQEIKFRAHGEETDLGTRIPSTTVGMSELAGGTVNNDLLPPVKRQKSRRPVKRRSSNDFSDITSLKGMKW